MTANNADSPAMRVMEEAIELAIQERSPYPERAMFIDEDDHDSGAEIRRAIDEDRAVVLVAADGSARVVRAEPLRVATR